MTSFVPGTKVLARGLPWQVVETEAAGPQTRFRLQCLQVGLQGMQLDLMSPFEEIRPITSEFNPRLPGQLNAWLLYHQAFLLDQSLGSNAFVATQPGRLDVAPYQLVPVMRALRMSRARLLLADGVGLGKTVQAGVVLAEMIARRRAHRILIVSPAGPLLDQWNNEMRNRFGLRFTILRDWGSLQEERRKLVLGANAFDHVSYCLTSIDFAKQEKVLQDLERATWDMVVVDEAHHCVRMGVGADAEDSRRRRLAEVLARRCDGLLLLTATPHDGFDPHFASLVELLDPSLVDGRGNLRGDAYRAHVIRRLKSHIRDPETGKLLFKERLVLPRRIPLRPASTPVFAEMQRGIIALVAPRLRRAIRRKTYGEVLSMIALLKRSVSTAAACHSTLNVVLARFRQLAQSGGEQQEERRERLRTLRSYRNRLERYGTLSFEEEQEQAALDARDMAAEIFGSQEELEGELESVRRDIRRSGDRHKAAQETEAELTRLVEVATRARAEDPKLDGLLAQLLEIRRTEPRASILVYTEYTDSQTAVLDFLKKAHGPRRIEGEILSIRGEDGESVRTKITNRFCTEEQLILVSTDATAEGLNLHNRCHNLVHLELPYNPNRLEQRNGRIDRYGQQHDPHVRYLYLEGTFEERLLIRLVAKYEKQRGRLTFMPNTLGLTLGDEGLLTSRLLEGLSEEGTTLFKSEPKEIQFVEGEEEDTTSKAYAEMLEEIGRTVASFDKLAKTHTWLGEQGIGADARLQKDVVDARARGERQSGVDLLRFVRTALASDGGSVEDASNGIVILHLPTTWTFGLEGIPGYDPEARTLRLTFDRNQLEDEASRSLGYLGRAHPIVRRALDRMRSTQFSVGDGPVDRRVGAARSPSGQPEVLLTYSVAIQSDAGRAYERVLAYRTNAAGGGEVYDEPQSWEALAEKPVAPGGVWERHFASWGTKRIAEAKSAIVQSFEPLAREFLTLERKELTEERGELNRWLAQRADEICGESVAQQPSLFDTDSNRRSSSPSTPTERLSACATDASTPAARRREADGVLKLYQDRSADLDRRYLLRTSDPVPLGMLMLVPG
jgi:ERCC4-related helicase